MRSREVVVQSPEWRGWGRLLLVGGMVLLLEACATVAGGHIPPSTFEFHDIVSREGPEAGGWRVAQVNILLERVSRRRSLHAWCDVEVGIPIKSVKRAISDSVAQKSCSQDADTAAQVVLRGSETISAAACQLFREEMLRLLLHRLKGVRVTKFTTPGIRPNSFPDD